MLKKSLIRNTVNVIIASACGLIFLCNANAYDGTVLDVRTGLQSSILNAGGEPNTENGNALFENNQMYYEFNAVFNLTHKQAFHLDTRLGKKPVEGEKTDSGQTIDKIIKDAEVADVMFSYTGQIDDYSWLYFKPAVGFSVITNDRLDDNLFFDSFFGLGIKDPEKTSNWKNSFVEVGYGVSQRFESRDRVKGIAELRYNNKSELKPYINFKVDAGNGPDDFSVMYGVYLSTDTIIGELGKLFTPENPTP